VGAEEHLVAEGLTEIDALLKMGVWDEVDKEKWMNALSSAWAFKIK